MIDHWWQTESGWPMLAIMMGVETLPVKFGAAGMPVAGYAISILDENGKELPPKDEGYVAVKLPLPPGTMLDLWQDYARFESAYLTKFPGYYLSGDGGYKDEDGYVFITGRIDDVINVAGHRLSTAEMEEIVSSHPQIAECAVVGVNDPIKGQIPMALVVTKLNTTMEEFQIEYEITQLIRSKIGAIASLKNVIKVERLPKTRSGKTLRKLIRSILDNETITIPSTIDDETIVEEIKVKCQTYFESKNQV